MTKPQASSAAISLAMSAQVARFLDDTIPLYGASHADVTAYGVHVPLRNAEGFALTNTGDKVGFARRWNFRGWSGVNPLASLLFKSGDTLIELLLDKKPEASGAEHLNNVNLVSAHEQDRLLNSSYIGTDGRMLRAAP